MEISPVTGDAVRAWRAKAAFRFTVIGLQNTALCQLLGMSKYDHPMARSSTWAKVGALPFKAYLEVRANHRARDSIRTFGLYILP